MLFDAPTSTALFVQALGAASALGVGTRGRDASAAGHQVTTAAELAAVSSATLQRAHSFWFDAAASLGEAPALFASLGTLRL